MTILMPSSSLQRPSSNYKRVFNQIGENRSKIIIIIIIIVVNMISEYPRGYY